MWGTGKLTDNLSASASIFGKKEALASILFLGLSSCRSTESSLRSAADHDQPAVSQIGAFPPSIFTFSWHGTVTGSASYVRAAIEAAKKNASLTSSRQIPEESRWGFGLYGATDPIQSAQYGDHCSCIELKAGEKFQIPEDAGDRLELIQSPVGSILYGFLGGFYDSQGEPAIVIRSLDSTVASGSQEIDTNGGLLPYVKLSAAEISVANQALDKGQLCQFLKVFEKHWAIFLGASALQAKYDYSYLLMQKASSGQMPGLLAPNMAALSKDAKTLAAAKRFLPIEDFDNKALVEAFALELANIDTLGNSRLPVDSGISLAVYVGALSPGTKVATMKELPGAVRGQIRERLTKEISAFPEESALVSRFYQVLRDHSLLALK